MGLINVTLSTPPIQASVSGSNIQVILTPAPQISVNISKVGPQGATGSITTTTPVTVSGTTIGEAAGWTFYPIYNDTGENFIIYLPSAPAVNQILSFADALQNAGTYSITIEGNGNDIASFSGISTTAVINSNGGTINPLVWDSIGNQWTQFA